MPDEKTVLKQKGTGNTWNRVYLGSSTDIVERPNSEKSAEETFTEIENILPKKVDGTFRLYHSLNEISLTAGSETIQSIIDGMQNNSIMALPVGHVNQEVLGSYLSELGVSVGIRKGDNELKDAINNVLATYDTAARVNDMTSANERVSA